MLIPISTNIVFKVGFGSTRTGKTVQYQILDYDGSTIDDYTATGVVELGHGEYAVRKSFSTEFNGFIRWKDVEDGLYVSESLNVVADYLTQISHIFKIETGRWKILNNQMIFYDEDGTTPLYTFNLKDSGGSPTSDSPVERVQA